jgi:hypothetical protein
VSISLCVCMYVFSLRALSSNLDIIEDLLVGITGIPTTRHPIPKRVLGFIKTFLSPDFLWHRKRINKRKDR